MITDAARGPVHDPRDTPHRPRAIAFPHQQAEGQTLTASQREEPAGAAPIAQFGMERQTLPTGRDKCQIESSDT